MKAILSYDDSLDAFGVHGVGGIWGTIATGLFAEKAVNEPVEWPVLRRRSSVFGSADAYRCGTCLRGCHDLDNLQIRRCLIGIRVEKKDEIIGLDLTQQSEAAYTVIE